MEFSRQKYWSGLPFQEVKLKASSEGDFIDDRDNSEG